MRATSKVSILLTTMVLVSVDAVMKKFDDELPHVFRETSAYLPTFSQDVGYYGSWGKGSYNYYTRDKSNKKSKKNYKTKKNDKSYKDKKDKKLYYYRSEPSYAPKPKPKPVPKPTRIPTLKPTSSPFHSPTEIPAFSADSNSEDCPPVRPPTIVPPSPSIITAKPTSTIPNASNDDNRSVKKSLGLDAIDYTLLRNDSPPMKEDFLELQTVTASYFKDYMIDAYQISAQATLVDFTTLFVTAHFTPADPIHVQYQSSAFFSVDSINIPSAETVTAVLLQALDDPKPYINKLKAELSDNNPFCTTTEAIFTDPRATPVTRSYFTSQTGSIARIASAIACFAITIFASFLFLRRRNPAASTSANDDNYIYDDEVRSKRRQKRDNIVLREVFANEGEDCVNYCRYSTTCSPKGSASNSDVRHFSKNANRNDIHQLSSKNKSYTRLGVERGRNISSQKLHSKGGNIRQASDGIDFDYRRPKTTKGIRKFLTVMDGDII